MRHLGASLTAMLAVFFVSHAAHAMTAAPKLAAHLDCSVDLSTLGTEPEAPVEAPEAPADAPVAQAPAADAPVAEVPVAQAPAAEAPVADAPVAQVPTDVPADADMIYGAVDESEPRTPSTTERDESSASPANNSGPPADEEDDSDLSEPVEV